MLLPAIVLVLSCPIQTRAYEFRCQAEDVVGMVGPPGRPGKMGPKGEPGDSTVMASRLISRIEELEKNLSYATAELAAQRETLKKYEKELAEFRAKFSNVKPDESQKVPVQVAKTNTESVKPSGCSDFSKRDALVKSGSGGTYMIFPESYEEGIDVVCDTTTDGGGWIVFQRRSNRNVTFERKWNEYENGFGSLEGDFWLGLEAVSKLTATGEWEMRIELTDWNNERKFANYGSFRIMSKSTSYKLIVGDFSGDAKDAMVHHNGFKFTTADADNDPWEGGNCAKFHRGGWWFNKCANANLNGVYVSGGPYENALPIGIVWKPWHGFKYSLKATEMKIRKVN